MRKSKSKKFFGTPFYPLSLLTIMMLAWLLIPTVDTVKIQEPFENMEYQGAMKDGPDQFVVYSDKDATRWYRVIIIDDGIRYVSECPCLVVQGDLVKIQVRWIPNRYADCKGFLKLAGKDPGAFCRRYHLPVSRIKTICRGRWM